MSRILVLKGFYRGPQVDLLGPRGAGLAEAGNDRVSDGARRNHGFLRPIGFSGTEPGGVDLAVNDDVDDVDTFGMKLSGQRLAEHA